MRTILRAMIPSDFLTREEFQKLLSAARTKKERAILLLLGGCGLRVSEVTALRAENIAPQDGFIYIQRGKGGKDRTVTAPKAVFDALIAYMREGLCVIIDPLSPFITYFQNGKDYLFEGRQSGHLSSWEVAYILDQIAEAAKMQEHRPPEPGKTRHRKKITPHLLRHSHASWMLDLDMPISDVQQQLGHASIATTGLYLQKKPNQRRESFLRHGGNSIVAIEKDPIVQENNEITQTEEFLPIGNPIVEEDNETKKKPPTNKELAALAKGIEISEPITDYQHAHSHDTHTKLKKLMDKVSKELTVVENSLPEEGVQIAGNQKTLMGIQVQQLEMLNGSIVSLKRKIESFT